MCALLFFKEVRRCQEKFKIEYLTKKEKEGLDFLLEKEQNLEGKFWQGEGQKAEKDWPLKWTL